MYCKVTTNNEYANEKPVNVGEKRTWSREFQFGDQQITLVFSTVHLLKNFSRQRQLWEQKGIKAIYIQDDATYKINVEGLPIHAIGVPDIAQSFHLCAFSLILHEDKVRPVYKLQMK